MNLRIRQPFFNTNTKDKFKHDSQVMIDRTLNSYASEEVFLNDEITPTKVILRERYDSNGESMKIQTYSSILKRGSLITYRDDKWLVTSKPEDDGVYSKAYMTLCTGLLPIMLPKTVELLVDENGKPILNIYGDEQYVQRDGGFKELPCIVETNYYNKDTNTQMPILDGTIQLTLRYNAKEKVKLNYQFEMYGNKYKVNSIDYSKVYKDEGLVKLICKVVV